MKLRDFNFIFALLALALFDALFGGVLAARLQHTGWDQRVNDFWQIAFGTICGLTVALFAARNARWQAIYLLAMLLTYSEDLLFYPVLWVLNDIGVTNLISGGFDYNFPPYLWPWSLSGWFGFVTRLALGETIKLPTVWAMLLTVGTLAMILWHMQMRKDKQNA